MKHRKLSLILFLIIPFILLSCQEAEFPKQLCGIKSVKGSLDDVAGKWKLAGMRTFNMQTGKMKVVDHSCDNIMYHFQDNDNLTITNTGDQELYPSGDYTYNLSLEPFHETMEGFTLKIGNTSWPCYIYSDRMTLDSSPVDGPTLYFVRIN